VREKWLEKGGKGATKMVRRKGLRGREKNI